MENGSKYRGRSSVKKNPLEEADEKTGEILRTAKLLFEPGVVVELRALKGRETVSGYFDDHVLLAREASKLEDQGYSVYVTINEVDPALLARASNRARKVYKEPTTSDNDVLQRRWLPLDFDPARPSGVSATDAEKSAARRRALEVREFLRELGWPEPAVGDSGNGYHLLYPIELPNDRASLELVKGLLEALSFKFSDEAVEVDTTTCNAARIWKLYGTTARKGDDIPQRPHRASRLLKVPKGLGALEVADQKQLEEVARTKPPPPPREEGRKRFDPDRNGHKLSDLSGWIGEHEVPVKREGPWGNGGYRYILEECPWNGHTDNAAYIVQLANGAIASGCHHDSCQGYGWQDLRKHYEPDAYESGDGNSANTANIANGGDEPKNVAPWEPPAPFQEFDLPTFPTDALPGWVREFVEAEAQSTQTPVDLPAMLALAVGALACAKVVEVEPWDGWREPTNLFTATAMPPGSRKTKVFADATAPVEEFAANLVEEKATEIAEQQTKYKIYEGRLQKAQKAAANAKDEDLDRLTAEAAEAGSA